MFEIGLSTCGKPYGEQLFRDFADAGIKSAEISLSLTDCLNFDYKKASEFSYRYGVALRSFHLPFMPFEEIDISNPRLSKKSLSVLSEMIKRGSDVGIGIFVVHPSGEPIAECDRASATETSMESLCRLAETSAQSGSVIAVEDLPRTCLGRNSDDILKLISADDRLGVCFDTNHLLKEDNLDFIKKTGNRIIATHVSDYDGIDEKHWLPGEGIISWHKIALALKECGYNGAWTYEVGYNAPATRPRSRKLTPSDFVRNANEIFENQIPTTII